MRTNKNISQNTIIFDLGGVIIDLDRERCVKAFERLGLTDANSMLGNYTQNGAFFDLEKGTISASRWRDIIRKQIGGKITDKEIDNAFNSFIVGIPLKRLVALRKLKERHRIVMLSNTNEVMFESIIPELFAQEGMSINDYFDDIFVSFRMGLCKPSKEIFCKVASELGIKPNEAIFLDDSPQNIAAASELGFSTILIEPNTDFTDKIKL